jgi:hypothetical protein
VVESFWTTGSQHVYFQKIIARLGISISGNQVSSQAGLVAQNRHQIKSF